MFIDSHAYNDWRLLTSGPSSFFRTSNVRPRCRLRASILAGSPHATSARQLQHLISSRPSHSSRHHHWSINSESCVLNMDKEINLDWKAARNLLAHVLVLWRTIGIHHAQDLRLHRLAAEHLLQIARLLREFASLRRRYHNVISLNVKRLSSLTPLGIQHGPRSCCN
jgi:hypothetical protein